MQSGKEHEITRWNYTIVDTQDREWKMPYESRPMLGLHRNKVIYFVGHNGRIAKIFFSKREFNQKIKKAIIIRREEIVFAEKEIERLSAL